jgi:hypothetical protein
VSVRNQCGAGTSELQPATTQIAAALWRDVQNVEHAIGKYIISDHPLSEEEWARERATVIDETPIEELPAPTK